MKLGFADAMHYVADQAHSTVPVKGLLDKAYAAERRKLIGDRALDPVAGKPPAGGTVYLCAADGDGMMISMIQSNYQGFGSGIVVPGTGISLQNRGAGFVLEAGHPNLVAPGKRPYHTIIPAFMTHGGEAVGPFGVMGGYMQPQGHLQMVVNQVDYGMNPQASLDAPRWQWLQGREIADRAGCAQPHPQWARRTRSRARPSYTRAARSARARSSAASPTAPISPGASRARTVARSASNES